MEACYPTRQRCKTCRKSFKENVLGGLYCSYKCGNYPSPAKNITDAPRGCKREVNGKWDYKTRFRSESEVPKKYQDDPSTNIYECDNCHMYHIGHSRVETVDKEERLVRYVTNLKELGSVISRYMESKKIDKKVLAKKLKIPAIRITEIQEGSTKATAYNLMLLLNELHLRIEITGPPVRR